MPDSDSATDMRPTGSPAGRGLKSRPELSMNSRPPSHKHDRGFSVVSISTDQELFAVAELMSPTVVSTPYTVEEYLEGHFARADSPLGETNDWSRTSRKPDGRDSLSPISSSLDIPTYFPPSPSAQSTYFSESDADHSSDDYERAYPPTPATSSYTAFHLPRPRLRLGPVSAIDSDTPSLTSSASYSSLSSANRSAHRRSTPTTPMTPDFTSSAIPHLSIIEERHPEDFEISCNLGDDTKVLALSSNHLYVGPHLTATKQEPLRVFQSKWAKKKIPNLENLSVPSGSARSPMFSPEPSPLPSPLSSAFSVEPFPGPYSDSRTVSPMPSTPTTMRSYSTPAFLSRLTSPVKKDRDSSKAETERRRKSQTSSIDSKSSKAEERKAKKAEAKARTEALALELKIRAQERAAANKRSTHTSRSAGGDRIRMLDDRAAMFGGFVGL